MGSCSAITQAGERCRSIAITGSDYCHAHHPDRAEARKKAARHGGKRGGRGRPQVELNDIKERIVALADAVENGEMKTGVGAVVNQILNTYLRAITVELQITEQLELVERLEALEQQLEQRRSRAWG
jgi:hypothetical protein